MTITCPYCGYEAEVPDTELRLVALFDIAVKLQQALENHVCPVARPSSTPTSAK